MRIPTGQVLRSAGGILRVPVRQEAVEGDEDGVELGRHGRLDAGVQVDDLKPELLKGMYFQLVETRVLSTQCKSDVNLHHPYRGLRHRLREALREEPVAGILAEVHRLRRGSALHGALRRRAHQPLHEPGMCNRLS